MEEKRNVPKLRFPGFTDPWEQRRLGECGTTYGGLSGKTKEDFGHGEARFVPYTNIFENPIADTGRLESIEIDPKQNQVRFGDAFFTVSSETPEDVGMSSVWLSDQPNVYLNSFCFGYRQDGSFDSDYLAYMLRSQGVRYDIVLLAQGISRFNISKNKVMELDVPFPEKGEQELIGTFFRKLDSLIALHQRELDHVKELKKGLLQKMFPKEGTNVPELRFPGFTDPWEQRRLGDEFDRINERNDGSFGREHWISVSRMFFQDPEAVQSNNIDTRTYVMREGDIAFEGHPNADFQFGRFVANDIGDGVVSELFPVYRHKVNYDNSYWKYAIQLERIMAPIFAKAITSSGNSSNKLDSTHFLKQQILVPGVVEQQAIGALFQKLDSLIALHQRELDHVKELKKGLLQQMFV